MEVRATGSLHVCGPGGQTGEPGSEHDTDIPDVYWHVDPSEEIPYQAGSDH